MPPLIFSTQSFPLLNCTFRQTTVISILFLLLLFSIRNGNRSNWECKRGSANLYHHGFSQYCSKILEENTLFLTESSGDPIEALTLIIINVQFSYICIEQSNFSNACSCSVLLWQPWSAVKRLLTGWLAVYDCLASTGHCKAANILPNLDCCMYSPCVSSEHDSHLTCFTLVSFCWLRWIYYSCSERNEGLIQHHCLYPIWWSNVIIHHLEFAAL